MHPAAHEWPHDTLANGQRRHRRGVALDVAIAFFTELGLELEGRAMIEGDGQDESRACATARRGRHDADAGRQRRDRALAVSHAARGGRPPNCSVNSLGYLGVIFAVDDLDDTLTLLRKHALLRSRPGRNFSSGSRSKSAEARAWAAHSRLREADSSA